MQIYGRMFCTSIPLKVASRWTGFDQDYSVCSSHHSNCTLPKLLKYGCYFCRTLRWKRSYSLWVSSNGCLSFSVHCPLLCPYNCDSIVLIMTGDSQLDLHITGSVKFSWMLSISSLFLFLTYQLAAVQCCKSQMEVPWFTLVFPSPLMFSLDSTAVTPHSSSTCSHAVCMWWLLVH